MTSSRPPKATTSDSFLEKVQSELRQQGEQKTYDYGTPRESPTAESNFTLGERLETIPSKEVATPSRGVPSSRSTLEEPWKKTGEISIPVSVAQKKRLKTEKKAFIPEGFPGPTTVLFITAAMNESAPAKQILEIAQIMRPVGLGILIAAPSGPPYGFELKRVSDKLISIPPRNFSLSALLLLRKQVLKNGVNVIHSHARIAGLYSRLLRLITGVEVVHSFHGVSAESGIAGKAKLVIDQLLAFIPIVPVFNSEIERQKALKLKLVLRDNVSNIIPDSINLAKFPKRKPNEAPFALIDKTRPSTFGQMRIGGFLQPDSKKRHTYFLKLASDLATQGRWSCAGLPRQRLIKLGRIHDALEVMGPIQDIEKWLYSLDVFVSTSSGNGTIHETLQAMASGCVCLLSDVPAHQAFAKHHAALLFDPADPKSLAKLINDVRSDKSLQDMLIGNSRYMLERLYSDEAFRNTMLESYRLAAKRTAKL
jgi:glycosyltransferase involved in cell wall biosynthesis